MIETIFFITQLDDRHNEGHGRRKGKAKALVRMGMHSDTDGEVTWHGKHRSIGLEGRFDWLDSGGRLGAILRGIACFAELYRQY